MQTQLLGRNPTVRALTGAATLICNAVAAVYDPPGSVAPRIAGRSCSKHMLGKNRRRSQNAATEVNWRAPEEAQ